METTVRDERALGEAEEVPVVSAESRTWIVIEGEALPPGWANRAAEAWIVRLLPGEVQDVLTTGAAKGLLDESETHLARLIARGMTTHKIALELGVDHRTVQRRIARLRVKLGASTKAELTSMLAGAGL